MDASTPTSTFGISEGVAESDAVYRKIKTRLLPFLVLCYVFAYIDRSNIGFAKLEFTADLGFSDAVYGLGASLFYAGYVLFEIPSNLMLHRIGARKTLLRIMIPWGLVTAAAAFMVLPWHYYILRFLLGVAEAGFFPGVLLYLTYWVPSRVRASVMAVFLASMGISGVIGGPVSGAIMHGMAGVGGMSGWQWLFIIEGLPACALGVVAFYYLSDRPATAPWLTKAERDQVTADIAADAPKAEEVSHSFGAALRSRRFWGLAALGFGIMTSTNGLFLWLPTIIKNAGHSSVLEVGLYSAIPFVFAVVVQYLNARHSDRVQERRMHAVRFAVLGTAGWLVMPLVASTPWAAIAVLTVIAVGTMGAMGPFWSMPAALLKGTAAAGGIATITTISGIGNLITPAITGWISSVTGSLTLSQLLYGAVLGIGVILMLILIRADR